MVKVGSHQPTVSLTGIADPEGKVKIILFGEAAYLSLPLANINTYSSLRTKGWLREGVGGQFPEKYNDPSK